MSDEEDEVSVDSASESDNDSTRGRGPIPYFQHSETLKRNSPTMVYVHGIAGADYCTWEYERADFRHLPTMIEDSLREMSPGEREDAGHIEFKYSAKALFEESTKFEETLNHIALDLLETISNTAALLEDLRDGINPIVIVAHDIGGVIVKKALLLAREYTKFRPVAIDVDALILFGTPQTPDTAIWESSLLDLSFALHDLHLSDIPDKSPLKEAAAHFSSITYQFTGSMLEYRILSIYQKPAQNNRNLYKVIIPKDVAVLGTPQETALPRQKSHFDLCRFELEDDQRRFLSIFIIAALFTDNGFDSYRFAYLRLLKSLTPCLGSASLFAGSRPSETSFDWILEDETFRSWKDSPRGSILRIRGSEGSGKTSLSQYLVQHFTKQEVSEHTLVAAYFFDKENRDSRTVDALCRSLAGQLLSSNRNIFPRVLEMRGAYPEVFDRETNAHKLHRPFISDPACWYLLRNIVATTHDAKIILIVDATDECVGQSDSFIKDIMVLMSTITSPVKVLLSGSKERTGRHRLPEVPVIQLDNIQAMQIYAEESMRVAVKLVVQERPILKSFEDRIFAKISEKQPLNLLDSTLKLKYLRLGELQSTPRSVNSALVKISDGAFAAAFAHALDITDTSLRKWGLRALAWMVYAFRPLRLGELATVLAMPVWGLSDPFDEHFSQDLEADLVHSLGTIISIEHNVVNFAHDKLRDLARNHIEMELTMGDSDAVCHRTIFRTCMAYLSYDRMHVATELLKTMSYQPGTDLADLPAYSTKFGLYLYAMQFWSAHYQNREVYFQEDIDCARDFVENTWSSDSELMAYDAIGIVKNVPDDPVLFAVEVGLVDTLKTLDDIKGALGKHTTTREVFETAATSNRIAILERMLHESVVDEEIKLDALIVALTAKAYDACQILMDAIVIEEVIMEQLGDLLIAAASAGQAELVKKICKTGREVESEADIKKAVCAAASTNRLEILQYVLNLALVPANKSKLKESPYAIGLHAAVRNGHLTIAEYLVRHHRTDMHQGSLGRSLQLACTLGFSSILCDLLNNDNVNQVDDDGRTALHHTAVYGCVHLVETLLRTGADIDFRDTNGESPLFLAVRHNQAEMVRLLVQKGAARNISNKFQDSLLHVAVSSGRLGIFKSLVDTDTDLERTNDRNTTPLIAAIHHGREDIVKYLIDQGANIESTDDDKKTALLCAVSIEWPDVVRMLLLKGADATARDKSGQSSLHIAASLGSFESLEVLTQNKLDIEILDDSHRTPLHVAVERGNRNCVECLLRHGAATDVFDEYDQKVIDYASEGRNYECGYLILRYRPNDSFEEAILQRLFHNAALGGNFEAVKLILEKCKNSYEVVNSKDEFGYSALANVADGGSLEVMRAVLDKGAVQGQNGKNLLGPLHSAVRQKSIDMVNLLLENGVDINQINEENDNTALQVAVAAGSLDLIRLLLRQGANANVFGRFVTPLQLAVQKSYTMTVELLKHGANVRESYTLTTAVNSALLSFDDEAESPAILDLLFEHGACLEDADIRGMTAVHVACMFGLQDLVESWVAKDPLALSRKDKQGRTAIHFAATRAGPSLLKWILDRLELRNLKDVDLLDVDGWSPLHWSCKVRYSERVWQLLVDHGIDIDQKALNGWSAADVAIYHGLGADWNAKMGGSYSSSRRSSTDSDVRHSRLRVRDVNNTTSNEALNEEEHSKAKSVRWTVEGAGNDQNGGSQDAGENNGKSKLFNSRKRPHFPSEKSIDESRDKDTKDESTFGDRGNADTGSAVEDLSVGKLVSDLSQPSNRSTLEPTSDSTRSESSILASEDSDNDSESNNGGSDLNLQLRLANVLHKVTGKPKAAAYRTSRECVTCGCDIWGPLTVCAVCQDYYLCFKCSWHKESTHPFHEFDLLVNPGETFPPQTGGPVEPIIPPGSRAGSDAGSAVTRAISREDGVSEADKEGTDDQQRPSLKLKTPANERKSAVVQHHQKKVIDVHENGDDNSDSQDNDDSGNGGDDADDDDASDSEDDST